MSAEETAFAGLAERTETSPGAEMVNGTSPNSSDGAEAPVVAHSSPAMNDSGQEPAVPFLQSLVDAMRKIAEQTRDDAMAQLRAGVAERSAGVRSETEQRAAELHELANADLKSIEDWERGETQRIRDEAAVKVSARNATLEAQLAANTAAGEGATTAVEARVDAFEAEMSSFFAQLNDIHDPAALASRLKRIPQAPSLNDVAVAAAGDTAPSPSPAAAEPNSAKAPDVMGVPKQAPAWTAARGNAAPQPASDAIEVPEAKPASETASAEATDGATTDGATADAAEVASVEPEAVEPPVAESTTQVVVTGLTSFGAITSFKQSLEGVNGINRVSLGLGTSGEFIFTAAHREGFDLSAAIQSFEDSAQFVTSNGQLRVTVGAKA
ncbi:MAG TPA: hypothetical protein VIN32_07510 [Candidatus Limnocylindria bacterium]